MTIQSMTVCGFVLVDMQWVMWDIYIMLNEDMMRYGGQYKWI